MRRLGSCVLGLLLAGSLAHTQEPISFKGETIRLVVGTPPDGGRTACRHRQDESR